MYARKFSLTRKNQDVDPAVFRDFIQGLYNSDAYSDVNQQVMEFRGFKWKKQMMYDGVDDCYFEQIIAFELERDFIDFIHNPMITSIWEIVEESAKQVGIVVTYTEGYDLDF